MKTMIAILVLLFTACSKGGGSGTPNPIIPAVSINSINLPEGNSGSTAFAFTVTLNNASSNTVTVTYSTLEGTAKAGEDYTAVTNQSVVFQPNETSKTISINVVGDDVREADDEFNVMLAGATNATIQEFKGTAIITNDDIRVPFTNAGYDAPTTYAGYTLAWADEFNTGSLDATAWTVEGGDGCPGLCGWGNNELEYYTGRPENLFFQDGKMLIEARKESFGGKNYTSSKIVSRGKKIFKFGRIDIRAKLPKGRGIWPALWMLPQSNVYGGWPTSGEMDIMEMVGHEAGKVYATMHYGPGPGSINISRGYTLPGGALFNDEFHVFSMEWKLDQIKCYVDGILYSTVNKADLGPNIYPFNENFFFIMNLAVGGNWPGSPDASTNFPQWMVVDYVRVYQ
jgi:beta-glucanase (GH16 family)